MGRLPAMKNPHAVALGRKGGCVTSDAKAAAARENGKRGGRPRKDAQRSFKRKRSRTRPDKLLSA